MNSKITDIERIELYVNAEELHFLAHAASDFITDWYRVLASQGKDASDLKQVRLCTNHLQELSMRLRTMRANGRGDPSEERGAQMNDYTLWKRVDGGEV